MFKSKSLSIALCILSMFLNGFAFAMEEELSADLTNIEESIDPNVISRSKLRLDAAKVKYDQLLEKFKELQKISENNMDQKQSGFIRLNHINAEEISLQLVEAQKDYEEARNFFDSFEKKEMVYVTRSGALYIKVNDSKMGEGWQGPNGVIWFGKLKNGDGSYFFRDRADVVKMCENRGGRLPSLLEVVAFTQDFRSESRSTLFELAYKNIQLRQSRSIGFEQFIDSRAQKLEWAVEIYHARYVLPLLEFEKYWQGKHLDNDHYYSTACVKSDSDPVVWENPDHEYWKGLSGYGGVFDNLYLAQRAVREKMIPKSPSPNMKKQLWYILGELRR